jgi:hypothetical protein
MNDDKNSSKQELTPASSTKLVVHKSCYYTDKGLRKVYRGGQVWQPESDQEFLKRFLEGEDVSIMDLERCCKSHPLLKTYASEGKDYEAVITGVVEGVPYRTLFKDHGFVSWGTFRSMTEYVCPGLKSMFNIALKLRDEFRLERAEQALEKRAIDGVKEEVYTQSGKLAGYRTRYSDKLLEVHLKALNPEKYSERHNHQVTGMVLSVNMGLRDGTEAPPDSGHHEPVEAEVIDV